MEENTKLQKELDKCLEDNKAKSEFISMVTHQLRTPLSGLKWTFKMLLDGDLGSFDDDQKKIVEKGSESTEKMIKLLQEIITANQNNSWDFQYSFSKTDVSKVIENTIAEFLEEARVKNITISFHHPDKNGSMIEIDSEKLSLAVQNLIENAIKYSNEGDDVAITLSIDDKLCKISIKDSGIGIPEEQQSSIFEKFFRADNAKSMKKEGTGLGLFTAKKIIERHGGTLVFVSTEGKGTTFTITLPLTQ